MNNEIKMRMKKILCRMEDDPVQIDNYLRQLREFPDGEERINCAWDIITKVFEEDSIRQLEMSGRFPNLSNPDDGNHYDGDEDDEDEDETEDSEDENEDDSDNDGDESDSDDESDEDEEDTSDEDEDDSDGEDEENDSDSDVDDDEEDSEDDEDDKEDDSSDLDNDSSEDDEDTEDEDESDSDDTDDEETSKKSVPKDNGDSEKVMQKIKDSMVKASPSPDVLAGVKLPLAEKTEVSVMPTPEVISLKNSSLEGIKKAKVEKTDEGVTLRIASADGDKFGNGTVYVLPADTGKEVEVRIMELRASTDENLNLARKIHEEIARSVAEERQIRDSMYELVVAYQELAKQLTDNAQQAGEIRQKLVDGTVRAERFMNEDMSRMLQQRAQEATNDFYQESKDHYNDLFKAAVRRYKQFTEAVMDFQDKIADESARRVRTIESKLGMVQKVSYGCVILLLINLVVAILFKVF